MSKLLLLALLFSGHSTISSGMPIPRDTIITTLAPSCFIEPSSTPYNGLSRPATNPVILEIRNTSAKSIRNLIIDWSIQSDGIITKKGKIAVTVLPANSRLSLRPGPHMPNDTMGETFLLVRVRSALSGSTLTEQVHLLRTWLPHLSIAPAGHLIASDETDTLTIHSPDIRISFNRQTGWLEHYEIKGVDLLDDRLGLRSLSDPPGPRLQLFSTTTSADQIIVRTEYTIPALSCLLHLAYTINAAGEMLVSQTIEPDTTQPTSGDSIRRFGMQWYLPPGYDSITVYGPKDDSSAIGMDHDGTNRSGVRWFTTLDRMGNGLRFIADTNFLHESVSKTQINIDRSGAGSLPIGNYQYIYKVKPLVIFARQ